MLRTAGLPLCALVLLAGLPALAYAKPPTPDLIQRAERAGKLDRSRADLYRAYAIAAPERLPAAYRSGAPWDGTLTLLQVRRDLPRLRPAARREIKTLLAKPGPSCTMNSSGTLPNTQNTTHFHITYGTVGGGLSAAAYAASLETAWQTEVDSFGWAAPPVSAALGNRYDVRIDSLAGGLYGFVSSQGTFAGLVGDNPATSWNEGDAYASCMVLNRDYSGFPSSPQASLDSTTAHEFNHSIQYGYGALTGTNAPDEVFVEGGATWMEDEVQDAADDNYNYLWPIFGGSMGEYDDPTFPYPYWITFRGLTERYGTGVAGGGEQVMQDFWELTSQNAKSNLDAMESALEARGTTLADAFHAYAVTVKFNRTCGGGYVYPYCFEEGAGYLAAAGSTPLTTSVASVGGSASGSVEDNYAIAWVGLSASSGAYNVSLSNTSAGGQLRGTVACDTGSSLSLNPLPTVATGGHSSTLVAFQPSGCTSRVLVITTQGHTVANPSSSPSRSFSVSTGSAPPDARTLSVTRTGSGAGTVTSSPDGIDCGSDCSETYALGTPVTLTATPASGSSFAGWSGACSGTGSCTVTMDASQAVEAAFELGTGTPPSPTPPQLTPSGPPPSAVPDVVAPAISSLRLSPTAFRAARTGPALAAVVGTHVSFKLSEVAAVTFRIKRLLPGRRVGGRCVRPTAQNRGAPGCTRSVLLRGRILRQLAAGTSKLRYRGRLAGRRLRPGRYTLIVRARDAAGNRSSVHRVGFRIVR